MRFSEALINKLAKAPHDKESYMVALYPSKSSRNDLLDFQKSNSLITDYGEAIDRVEMHCTLRYFDKDCFPGDEETLKCVMEQLKPKFKKSYKGKAIELSNLGDAIVILLDSSEICAMQEKVDSYLQVVGAPTSDFPSFKAHVSLAYDYQGEMKIDLKEKNLELEFDTIKLVDQDDKVLWSNH